MGNLFLAGDDTNAIDVLDARFESVTDYGTGNTTIRIDGSKLAGTSNGNQTLTLTADAAFSTDAIELSNVTLADVRFKRLANGDLQILLPGDSFVGIVGQPSIVLKGQFSSSHVFNTLKIGGETTPHGLADPDEFPVDTLVQPLTGGLYMAFASGTYMLGGGFDLGSQEEETIAVASRDDGILFKYDPVTSTAVFSSSFGGGNALAVNLPNVSDVTLEDPGAMTAATPLALSLNYLKQLGASGSMTEQDLIDENRAHLFPVESSTTLTGTTEPDGFTHAWHHFHKGNDTTNTITGPEEVTIVVGYDGEEPILGQVEPTNVLHVSDDDVSNDTITNVQVLDVDGHVALTESQFTQFDLISGDYLGAGAQITLYAAGGGTFDATDPDVNIDANTDLHQIIATDWSGTTLIGSDQDGQVLTASLLGDDTLEAGDGEDTWLVAGRGINTLVGSASGETTFQASDGLAPGSSLTGQGTGNSLMASYDISQALISGIQTLEVGTNLVLTATQFNSFSSVEGLQMYAATAGTYDWSGGSGINSAYALSNSGTTFIGNSGWLYASESGDDTMVLAAGDFGTIDARDSTGDLTLTVGSGSSNTVYAGIGENDITLGAGNNNKIVAEDGLASGSSITSTNTTTSILEANGDISAAAISGIHTLASDEAGVTLTAAQLAAFSGVSNSNSAAVTLNAASVGSYSLASKTISTGAVAINGSSGADTLTGSSGIDMLYGNDDADTIVGNAGDDLLEGGDGADTLSGGDGNDTLDGGDGNDALDSGAGENILIGGAGDDTLAGGTVASSTNFDRADYSAATDGIEALLSSTSSVTGDSSVGTDSLTNVEGVIGSEFDDEFEATGSFSSKGSAFNDFEGLDGDDLIAGNGSTRISYISAVDGVTVDLDAGTAASTVGGDAAQVGEDTFTGVNSIRGSGYDDTLSGTDGSGFERFLGEAGDDAIDGRGGSQDEADYITSPEGIAVTLTSGSGTVQDGWGSTDTLTGIEWIRGSFFADSITMDDNDNRVEGRGGADVINGMGGADILNGGDGNDTLDGGAGIDTINGGDGADIIRGGTGADIINGGDGNDIIRLFSGEVPSGETIDGGNGTDRLTIGNNNMTPAATISNMEELFLNNGVTNVNLTSAQFGDFDAITHQNGGAQAFSVTAAAAGTFSLAGKTITGILTLNGSSGADTLTGSPDNDTINGNNGDDLIEGGVGNDTLNGGGNTDTLTYVNAGSAVTVDLSNGSAQNTGGAGTDTISNFENLTGSAYNDNLTGTSGNNVILGGDGDDTISAGAGADTIDGGIGINTLDGGEGDDTYILERTYGASEIDDYDTNSNSDTLQLGDDIARDQLWFTQSGNDLVVQVIGTDAQMTVKDWYSGSDYQIEEIVTEEEDVLDHTNVQNLVSAMSGLSVPETITLSPEYHTALDSTIAANWA